MSIDISALNILDYAIIIILVVSAILSTLRGMTREALGLVGWPIAIFAAKYSAPVIEPMIVSMIKVGGIGQALSWALPFAVVVVLWFVIASVLAPGLKRAGLGARPLAWRNFWPDPGLCHCASDLCSGRCHHGRREQPAKTGWRGTFNPYVRASVISLSAMAPDDMRSRILDNVPSAPDMDIKEAGSDLAESARDIARETVADPAKDAASAVANETTTNFNLLEDEAKSQ